MHSVHEFSAVVYDLSATVTAFKSWIPSEASLRFKCSSTSGSSTSARIEPGLRVLIVDDVVSFGATLANLRGWLERQEAVVVGATTLAATYGGTKLKPPEAALDALLDHLPRVRELARSMGFKPECFTAREAYYLRGLKQEQDLDRLIDLSREMHRGRGWSQGRFLA